MLGNMMFFGPMLGSGNLFTVDAATYGMVGNYYDKDTDEVVKYILSGLYKLTGEGILNNNDWKTVIGGLMEPLQNIVNDSNHGNQIYITSAIQNMHDITKKMYKEICNVMQEELKNLEVEEQAFETMSRISQLKHNIEQYKQTIGGLQLVFNDVTQNINGKTEEKRKLIILTILTRLQEALLEQ